MRAGRSNPRVQNCTREDAIVRLRQAESFAEVAELVIAGDIEDVATPGVAASLAVLAGIAASDAVCCAKLKVRPRGQDHAEAVALLASVHPHGAQMSKDLKRLLSRKDASHYGLHLVGKSDGQKMVEWGRRITQYARKVIESS